MKYKLETNKTKPDFQYLVRTCTLKGQFDYYLYKEKDFDSAMEKVLELSISSNRMTEITEVFFINSTREYKGANTFRAFKGKIHYYKHEKPLLHIKFYVEAGEWLNQSEFELITERVRRK